MLPTKVVSVRLRLALTIVVVNVTTNVGIKAKLAGKSALSKYSSILRRPPLRTTLAPSAEFFCRSTDFP